MNNYSDQRMKYDGEKMKIKIRNGYLNNNHVILVFIIYFTTKLLWDNLFPFVFELLSLFLICVGSILFFVSKNIVRYRLKSYCIVWIIYIFFILANAFLLDNAAQFRRAIYEYIFYSLIFFLVYFLWRIIA